MTDFNSNDPSELSHKSANCLVDDSTTVYKYCPGIIIIAIIIFVFSVVKIPRVKSYVKIEKYSIGGQRSELGGKLSMSCKITALNRCTLHSD